MCNRQLNAALTGCSVLMVISAVVLLGFLIHTLWQDRAHKLEPQAAVIEWVYANSSVSSRDICARIVTEASKTTKPLLLLAIMEHESWGFNTNAVSKKGAIGLTQIMPRVWEKTLIDKGIIKERRDLFNITQSIEAGDYVLTECLRRSKGDITKALDLYLGEHNPHYVRMVLANLANLYLVQAEANAKDQKKGE